MELIHTIEKCYTKIDTALKSVIKDFAIEDIHLFRLEVKKLRSVIRLAGVASRKSTRQKLPKKMHTFYNAIGVIRNLQIQHQTIEKLNQEKYSLLTKPYLNFISENIEEQKELTKRLVKEKKHFAKEKKDFLKCLPTKLTRKSIRKFNSNNVQALATLMTPPTLSDESLHSIRKLLKIIMYTWSYTCEHTANLSKMMMSKEDIKLITKILGDFQDKCIGLDLLHEHYKKQQGSQSERIAWRRLETKWWNEKENARLKIHALFQKYLLQFTPPLTAGKFYLPLQ